MTEGLPLPLRPKRALPDKESAGFGFPVVWVLTAIAGSVDACGVAVLKDLYVSFMSGNTTALGGALARADWGRAGLISEIIMTFVAGAAAGTVLASIARSYHVPAVTFAVGVILALFNTLNSPSILALTFAMGALNMALQQAGGTAISITYVTGTLVNLGQGIGHLLCGDAGHWQWARQATIWPALLLGVVVTATLRSTHPMAIRVALPMAAFCISAVTFGVVWRGRRYAIERDADRNREAPRV